MRSDGAEGGFLADLNSPSAGKTKRVLSRIDGEDDPGGNHGAQPLLPYRYAKSAAAAICRSWTG